MLYTILGIGILLFLWIIGMLGSVGGSLIHILPIVALVVLVVQLVGGTPSRDGWLNK